MHVHTCVSVSVCIRASDMPNAICVANVMHDADVVAFANGAHASYDIV